MVFMEVIAIFVVFIACIVFTIEILKNIEDAQGTLFLFEQLLLAVAIIREGTSFVLISEDILIGVKKVVVVIVIISI